jgi:nitroreductase
MGALDKPNYLHSFDTGAAWANLALQASMIGYHSHCMIGIEMDRIRHDLGVPEGFRIEAGVAIGRRGDPATLPEALQAREMPSGRKPLADIAYPGAFRL